MPLDPEHAESLDDGSADMLERFLAGPCPDGVEECIDLDCPMSHT